MQTAVYTLDICNCKERKYNYEDHLEELLKQEISLAMQKNGLRVKLLYNKDIRTQKLDDLVSCFRSSYPIIILILLYIRLYYGLKEKLSQ
ncbi:hypothetical protein [Rickettsia honei]|uniref:hypothetical protein n=1 Tax=Rickettsia honei TaxID=37816 RepID=UPI0003806F59|nr:hypothetical protein [Rickettsia honei]